MLLEDYLFGLYKKGRIHDLSLSKYLIKFSYVDMDICITEKKYIQIYADVYPFYKVKEAYKEFIQILKKIAKLEPNLKDSMDKYTQIEGFLNAFISN